jgi:hypothetical protein
LPPVFVFAPNDLADGRVAGFSDTGNYIEVNRSSDMAAFDLQIDHDVSLIAKRSILYASSHARARTFM